MDADCWCARTYDSDYDGHMVVCEAMGQLQHRRCGLVVVVFLDGVFLLFDKSGMVASKSFSFVGDSALESPPFLFSSSANLLASSK